MNKKSKGLLKNKVIFIVFIFLYMFMNSTTAYSENKNNQKVEIVYFYINACVSCQDEQDKIEKYMRYLNSEKDIYKLEFKAYNVFEEVHLENMLRYCDEYNVEKSERTYPIMFVGDKYYQGEDNIENGLEELRIQLNNNNIPTLKKIENQNEASTSINKYFENMQGVGVFLFGLINGFNPCSLAMLLFLLSLFIVDEKINVLKVGLAYIAGKFIAYLLLGTVLYQVLDMLDVRSYQLFLKIIMGIFVVFIVSLNIQDIFSAKKEKYGEIKNQLPSKLRGFCHNIMKKALKNNKFKHFIIIAFLLGMIMSVLEFLCTGQVYLATILYIMHDSNALSIKAFTYLCVYSLAFILPLLVVIILIAKTKNLFNVSEKLRHRIPLIKLVTSIVLIVLAVYIIIFT